MPGVHNRYVAAKKKGYKGSLDSFIRKSVKDRNAKAAVRAAKPTKSGGHWFHDRMTKTQKKAYLASHPTSKYHTKSRQALLKGEKTRQTKAIKTFKSKIAASRASGRTVLKSEPQKNRDDIQHYNRGMMNEYLSKRGQGLTHTQAKRHIKSIFKPK